MLVAISPPPGLNSDDTTFSAQGRWADGNNVRFWEGKPQTTGGSALQFSISTLNGIPAAILPFTRSGAVKIAYGLAGRANSGIPSKLYVGSGIAAPADRSPASGPTGLELSWALAPWGDTLLAAPCGGTLYQQSGTSAAAAVATAPSQMNWMLVTAERQVLAFGCNEEVSTTFNPLCIRGCDLEDYTNWTTSNTNNAFENILDGAGDIVAARVIGSYVAVWTTDALYLGQFIGDPSQSYRFDRIDSGCGLIGPQAVIVVDQTAYWMGGDFRIRAWSPGSIPQTIPCSITSLYIDSVSGVRRQYISASHNSKFNEIRFDYSDSSGGGYPIGAVINRYIALSLADGTWFRGNGARTAIVNSGLLTQTDAVSTAGSPTTISADADGNFYLEETGSITWGGGTNSVLAPYITSADQYMDEGGRRMMIRRCTPDFKSQVGNVLLTLNMRDRPQSTATTKGPYTLGTTTTKKDFRTSGMIVSAKFSGDNTGAGSSFFRLGKPVFDTVPMGER